MAKKNEIGIEDMAVFCKRKGFVYPNSEIYGGLAGFFDYGPLGVELKNNIKEHWWKYHVTDRDDIVGIDGSIITHPKVWQASGHVESFDDVMVECTQCKQRFRADHLIEDSLDIQAEGLSTADIDKIIFENKVLCPNCKGDFSEAAKFNLMFSTNVGPKESDESKAFLRPETAQLMFTNFRLVAENARLKLPFGIAQIGRAFRNEISPRTFLFRCREFEQMEIEYFVHPEKYNDCVFLKEVKKYKMKVLSEEMQEKKKPEKLMSIEVALKKGIIKTQWHAYWLAIEHKWFVSLGANKDNFRIRQHLSTEKSHYALETWDLEYKFPFGWKELQGMANRTDFDLKQHMHFSKKDLSLYDEESKKKIVPHVIAEPSQGVDRAFLVFLFDAYGYDKKRDNIVLKLHPSLAPVKVGVFPLVNDKKILKLSQKVYKELKPCFSAVFDKGGSIGRRYARNDEKGTPYCITLDFDSLKKNDVTVRDRDSTKQVRVKIKELKEKLGKLLNGELKFEKAGRFVK